MLLSRAAEAIPFEKRSVSWKGKKREVYYPLEYLPFILFLYFFVPYLVPFSVICILSVNLSPRDFAGLRHIQLQLARTENGDLQILVHPLVSNVQDCAVHFGPEESADLIAQLFGLIADKVVGESAVEAIEGGIGNTLVAVREGNALGGLLGTGVPVAELLFGTGPAFEARRTFATRKKGKSKP